MQPSENPYASPQEVSAAPQPTLTNRQTAKRRLFQPGWVTVLSGIGMPFYQGWLAYRELRFTPSWMYEYPSVLLKEHAEFVLYAAISVAGSLFCIFGGAQLLKVRHFRVCFATCVVMIVPLTSPCSCLGFVVGGWTLIALLRQDTRAAFAEAA